MQRNLALGITLVTQITVSLPSSFFPRFAKENYAASDSTIGLIFAAYPLAQVITTPIWTIASQHTSRRVRFVIGLILSAAGILMFGFASSLEVFAASRFIQGIAAQGLLTCSLALIMNASDNVQRDVGLEEFFVGVGYMIGPAMGGVLFQYLGFEWAFIPLSICYVLIALTIPFVLADAQDVHATERGQYSLLSTNDDTQDNLVVEDGATDGVRIGSEIAQTSSANKQQQRAEDAPSWRDCLTMEIAILVLVAIVHAAAQSYKEVVLARHMHLGLAADAAMAGSVFTTEPVVYSFASFGVGAISTMTRKAQISLGLFVYAAGFILLATPPFLFVEPSPTQFESSKIANSTQSIRDSILQSELSSFSLAIPLSRSAEWALTIVSLALMGGGSALMLVPIVPAMLHCYITNSTNKPLQGDSNLTAGTPLVTSKGSFQVDNGQLEGGRPARGSEPNNDSRSRIDRNYTQDAGEAPANTNDNTNIGDAKEEASINLRPAAITIPEVIEDAISGIYSSSWSLGELVGPPVGGLMLEHLPQTREINCTLSASTCSWAYAASMTAFAFALCVVPAVVVAALRNQELCDTAQRQSGQQMVGGNSEEIRITVGAAL